MIVTVPPKQARLQPSEAWLNVSRPGHWNQLHSHAGAVFSAAYYVGDGGCKASGDEDPLAGRLLVDK